MSRSKRYGGSRKIKIALVQMKAAHLPDQNLKKAAARIRMAAETQCKIICLQELFLTKYFCQTKKRLFFRFAERVPGKTTRYFTELAKELEIVLIVPIFEKTAQGIYHNSVVVIDADGRILGLYRKMHIPHDPLYYEKFYFTPGDLGFKVFTTRYGRIGAPLCWDQWYPEAARLLALKGAEIIFYPTAIGRIKGESPKANRIEKRAWETVQVSHAIANGVFVACVNRVGRETGITFWGSSFVAGPGGEILAEASRTEEEILTCLCDLSEMNRIRRDWPFLKERRIDAYGEIRQQYADR